MKNTYFLFISLSFFLIPILPAQVNSVVTGNTASGNGGEVTYTIGQIDYTSIEDSLGSLNLGVQQPFEIYFLRINEPTEQSGSIIIFPNPANDNLYVNLTDNNFGNFQILDAQGKLINSGTLTDQYQIIDIFNLTAGIYFIHVTFENGTFETVKFYKF